jgi:hypothetical protein
MSRYRGSSRLSALLLLGSYVFGLNVHNIIHELGHGVAIWVQGGSIHGLVLHPFVACYAPSTAVPDHVLLYAGGALFGGTVTILFAVLAWRVRTPYMMPLVMVCAAGLLTTSRWILLAPFTSGKTDYQFLISLGVSPILIIIWGIVLLLIGLVVLVLFLPLIGVSHQTSFKGHLLVIEVGILPYFLAASLFFIVTGGTRPVGFVSGAITGTAVLAIIAGLSKWLRDRMRLFQKVDPLSVYRTHVAVVCGAALVLIVLMSLNSLPRDTVVQ